MQGEKIYSPSPPSSFPPALFGVTCAVGISAEDNNVEECVCERGLCYTRQVFAVGTRGSLF